MRADELRALPHVRRLIGDRGVTFDHAYAVDPVCCPSRVSILTGQYPHNSGVVDNVFPRGGFAAFDDSSSLGTWLDDDGYRTGFIGKYLNQYGKTARRYVPPGWDVWKATVRGVYAYRDPAIYNVNGELQQLPGYQTDTVTSLATTFIRANADRPMFLHVSYAAPHEATVNGRLGHAPVPARQYEHAFDGEPPPVDDPGYDEPDVSDKPPAVRLPRMSAAAARAHPALRREPARVTAVRRRGRRADRAIAAHPGRPRQHHDRLHLRQRADARRAPLPHREEARVRAVVAGAAADTRTRPADRRRPPPRRRSARPRSDAAGPDPRRGPAAVHHRRPQPGAADARRLRHGRPAATC